LTAAEPLSETTRRDCFEAPVVRPFQNRASSTCKTQAIATWYFAHAATGVDAAEARRADERVDSRLQREWHVSRVDRMPFGPARGLCRTLERALPPELRIAARTGRHRSQRA
jgi:hypothetical protein